MNDPSIEVSGLRKTYGATLALDGMSFTVPAGRVTGLIGPNGAGKSTTMRVILGLDAPDEGQALVGGQPYRSLRQPLRHVGALLDADALAPARSAHNHLLWLAHSQGMPARRVDEVIDLVGLAQAARRKAGGFSLGMRQRLGIAVAMLGDPPILMLDEPFNGLDPEGFVWMRGFLRALAAEGRVVLVSSHLMAELQDLADHVVVVGRGKVIADAAVGELLSAAAGDGVVLRTSDPGRALEVLHLAGATATSVDHDTLRVTGLEAQRIVAVLGDQRVPFFEVAAQRASLEDVYLRLTGGEVDYRAGADEGGAR
jgi:ABC-2 type transport system ATP-binding protein